MSRPEENILSLLVGGYESQIAFFTWSAGIFMATGLGFLIYVLISRRNKTKLHKYEEEVAQHCAPLITYLVFGDEFSKEVEESEKYLFENQGRKQILINELITLRKSLVGESARMIENYFVEKKLYALSLKNLRSGNKYRMIQAMNELRNMNYPIGERIMIRIINSIKDYNTRNYLIAMMIQIHPTSGLQFVLSRDYFISDWLQMRILQVLQEAQEVEFPRVTEWLAKGGSHAIFGCRLVVFAKSLVDVPDLVMLLKGDNDPLKIEVLRALNSLEMSQTSKFLMKIYPKQKDEVKLEILKTIISFDLPENLEFIKKCYQNEKKELRYLAQKEITAVLGFDVLSSLGTPFLSCINNSMGVHSKMAV